MAEFDLGQVAFVDRGVYSPAATYKMWDFITTIDSMYLYINNIPAIATDILDTDYWKCIADGKPATLAATSANNLIDSIEPAVYLNEAVQAAVYVNLNARITALELLLSNSVLSKLEVTEEFNLHGETNLILPGTTAPSITPDFVGQFYINTSAGITYQAKGIASSGDWKQTSN